MKGAKKLKPKERSGLNLPKPKRDHERILNTFMHMIGMALVMKMLPHMDKLKPVFTFAIGALKFISEWVGKILDGHVYIVGYGRI